MADRELWVDFNELDSDRNLWTLRRFADVPQDFEPGQYVTVGDDDGHRGVAVVTGVHDDVIDLQLVD